MPAWEAARASFASFLNASGLKPSTIKYYLRDIGEFYTWHTTEFGAGADPAAFSATTAQRYLNHLRVGRGHGPATLNRKLQSLRKFGHHCAQIQERNENPAQRLRLAKLPEVSAPPILDSQAQTALIAQAKVRSARQAARDYHMLRLILSTGIRASELAQLRWRSIDFHLAQLQLPGIETERVRWLPLPPDLVAELRLFQVAQDGSAEDLIFPGRGGQPLSVRMIQQAMVNLGRDCGCPLNVKLLRDSFARQLWQQSGNLAVVAERMGYRHLNTALRHIVERPEQLR